MDIVLDYATIEVTGQGFANIDHVVIESITADTTKITADSTTVTADTT